MERVPHLRIPRFLSEEECDRIAAATDAKGRRRWQQAVIRHPYEDRALLPDEPQYGTEILWLGELDERPDLHWLWQRFHSVFPGGYYEARLLRYKVGASVDDHVDHSYDERERKLLTAVSVQLSRPIEYTGGALVVEVGGRKEIQPKSKGTAITTSDHSHYVTTVQSGCRLSLVVFIYESGKPNVRSP